MSSATTSCSMASADIYSNTSCLLSLAGSYDYIRENYLTTGSSSSTRSVLLLSFTDGQLPFQDATTYTSLVALGALMLVIRYSRSLVFEPVLRRLGIALGNYTHGSTSTFSSNGNGQGDCRWEVTHAEQLDNFTSFSYRLLFRCLVLGLGLFEFYQNPHYWYDTTQLWAGYPHHMCSNTVQIVYLLQLAYHLEDLGTVFMEGNARKRTDFASMILHHVVTSLLLYGSSRLGTQRIGVIVSTLHAVTDVPKDFAQVAKQLDWKWCKRAGFVMLLMTWIGARVVLYPFKYVRSVFTEARESLVYVDGGMSNTSLNIFIALLSTLVLLNAMWCHMLITLVTKVLREGDSTMEDPLTKKDKDLVLAAGCDSGDTSDDDDTCDPPDDEDDDRRNEDDDEDMLVVSNKPPPVDMVHVHSASSSKEAGSNKGGDDHSETDATDTCSSSSSLASHGDHDHHHDHDHHCD